MKLFHLYIVIFFLFLVPGLGNKIIECGTQEGNFSKFDNISLDELHAFFSEREREDYWSPISFHIVRNSIGEGGIPLYRLEQGIVDLNLMYNNANLHFYEVSRSYIDSDIYLEIDSYDELNELRSLNVVENSINIYIVALLSPGDDELCGISSFVSSDNQGIVMSEGCFALPDNPSTLSHEVGHYFNLLHTHTGSGDSDGDGIIDGSNAEFVDGFECNSRGDDLCDTPADPNLSDFVNSQCEYFGDYVDGHGDFYQPDTGNLMSYSEKICRDHFSTEQDQLVIYTLLEHRPELNVPSVNPNLELDLISLTELSGNFNNVINPGEQVNLVIELNNISPWPEANNINVNLYSEDEGIDVINGQFIIDLIE